ncbi:MAG: ABC-F family ATP-binding cassette domain-containing protein [Dehalococcoidia bacterium]|nr:ABC-F family ATP-binding cassette domain-containing protein [Dehalococcoidia bacterium]
MYDDSGRTSIVMLTISNLSKSYGQRDIFSGVTVTVGARDRIAIIGPNGSGKTTLLEIIAGNMSPDSGSIAVRKGTTIGYLEQDVMPFSKRRLLDEVTRASTRITGLAHRIQLLQEELAESSGEDTAKLLRELGELQHQFEAADGYNAEYEARIILSGLGFAESDWSRSLGEFSGGWLMRAALAKLLLLNPDVLLLDEPTNHLDLESCIWFEEYLREYRGAVLVTSHDRAFLNRVVSRVIAIEPTGVILHKGNYDSFVQTRQKSLEVQDATAKKQELKIKKEMEFIETFRADKRRAGQVQSRIKRLEKVERIVAPRTTRKVKFSFPEPARSGEEVIVLDHILKSYGANVVYRDLSLVVNRGDRVALVGPNGAGKTTLLRMMAGVLPFDGGTRKLGHNVGLAYYGQFQVELLNPENTVLAELRGVALDETEQKLRGILGAFLFSGDDVDKRVSVLSGGESSRLAIAKMLLGVPNFLLMDEPTNHLDIPSREVLIDALEAYSGTLCFITHDRTLIRQIANRIVEVKGGAVSVFPGDYDSYLHWKEFSENGVSEVADDSKTDAAMERSARDRLRERKRIEGELRNEYYRQSSSVKKRIDGIETQISDLEAQLRQVEVLLASPEHYSDGAQVVETIRKHRNLKDSIASLTAEWERLSVEAESLSQVFEEAKENLEA